MNYKVCILAAGIGSRVGPFTEHINKSLLPVDFKAVISHIIEKFDMNVEFVIAVGHLKNTLIDYLNCAHKDRKITFVEVDKYTGKGSGPGYSLLQCRKYLNTPFIFYTSDTLVLEKIPLPTENWLGVSIVKNTENYCTVTIVNKFITRMDNKVISNNTNAFIGVAGVKDYEVFFEAIANDKELKDKELQVIKGFSALIDFKLKQKKFTWYDTGYLDGYVNANQKMSKTNIAYDFSKSDEFLYFVDNKVIKYFKDKKIIKNRYKRSKILNNLCPKIDFFKGSFYSYDKVEGEVLYNIINETIMHKFIHWLDEKLWVKVELSNNQLKTFKDACFNFYFNKTITRIETYQKKYKINDESTKINGIQVPSVKKQLNIINWDYLRTGIATNFHGDLQFDNILITASNDFIILDWRQDFSGIIEYGDQYYDLAKLNGGMIVSYKLIKENKFRYIRDSKGAVTIKHNIPVRLTNARLMFEKYLKNKNIDLEKVRILTGLVFLNMSPMHNEPFDHFIYNLGRLTLFNALQNHIELNTTHNN